MRIGGSSCIRGNRCTHDSCGNRVVVASGVPVVVVPLVVVVSGAPVVVVVFDGFSVVLSMQTIPSVTKLKISQALRPLDYERGTNSDVYPLSAQILEASK